MSDDSDAHEWRVRITRRSLSNVTASASVRRRRLRAQLEERRDAKLPRALRDAQRQQHHGGARGSRGSRGAGSSSGDEEASKNDVSHQDLVSSQLGSN